MEDTVLFLIACLLIYSTENSAMWLLSSSAASHQFVMSAYHRSLSLPAEFQASETLTSCPQLLLPVSAAMFI